MKNSQDGKALDTSLNYPTLIQLKAEWHKISPIVYHHLLGIDEAELERIN
ncbi:MAG: hypothetical protein SGJ04_10760 [Bacteroidota bacterium]|nr:hypothetical protein [Bacteroidota bacterium]